ncbi:hypothetical protein N7466_004924 [Penicillium verhagenii]|uniref:uncharacterized protein n=1 Tax=Penicillium verhagenii TaxID=1562060 RepID=UPI0025456B2F|nr:uncharacterized protein N7466_004924 [Penicillium verhagenii]KAJ5935377.1 hypothetical protein N7466_004924 [Penicillium verhagenii]
MSIAAPSSIYDSSERSERRQEFLETRRSRNDCESPSQRQETEPESAFTQDVELSDAKKPKLFHIDDSHGLQAAIKHKRTIPLYIGLTTGFCGSLTSFSAFIREVFLALSNDISVPLGSYSDVSLFALAPAEAKAPSGGFSFMALVAVLFTEIGLSLFGLFLGAHFAIGTSACMSTLPDRWLHKFMEPAFFILGILSWIAVVCLAALLPRDTQSTTL